jgi:dTDP-4-amino-4,6-dideoxygalactose transaminase
MIEYENLNKSNFFFYHKYINSFKNILHKGKFILGDELIKFENNFSNFLKIKYCSGVANGLQALVLSLKALNLPSNSEILVPANSYYACVLSIINAGLKPILIEPDIKTYNIDVSKIEKKITTKTKAIMAVHMYGKSCDMKKLLDLSNKYKLFLIEDCAQSHGAKFKKKYTGTFGVFGCFSFYPTKNLGGLGDGGAVVSKNKNYNTLIKKLRNYGSLKRYSNEIIGDNSRLDEIQSAFINIKLKYLKKINLHKRNLANIYFNKINNNFIKPHLHKDYFDVFYIYNLRTDKRDKFVAFLKKNGVITDIHYRTPPYKQKSVSNLFRDIKFPVSDEIHNTNVSLPISFFHKEKDIENICKIINRF